MINFKDLFRFSQKEVASLFKNATVKYSWRGLKLLQTPLNCFPDLDYSSQNQTDIHETDKTVSAHKFGKILIITPRASGKAHDRNLFRRRIKDIFYTNKLYLHPVNSILIAYKNAMIHDFDHLEKFLMRNVPPRIEMPRVETPRVETPRITMPRVATQAQASQNKTKNNKIHPDNCCTKKQSYCSNYTNHAQPLKLWHRLFIAIFDVIRPVFGFIGGACIYPVSCSDYAKHTLITKPFYKSIPLIILRVLSCNPITALILRWKRNTR